MEGLNDKLVEVGEIFIFVLFSNIVNLVVLFVYVIFVLFMVFFMLKDKFFFLDSIFCLLFKEWCLIM